MNDWKIRLEEKLKKSVVELTGIISCIVYNIQNDYFNTEHLYSSYYYFKSKNFKI